MHWSELIVVEVVVPTGLLIRWALDTSAPTTRRIGPHTRAASTRLFLDRF
jgi:hypothetical protein